MDAHHAPASGQRRPQPAAAPGGLGSRALASIPIFRYSAHGTDDPGECAVCQSPFERGQRVRGLPRCNHLFHAGCVDAWLRRRATCRLCRSPVIAEASLFVQPLPPPPPPPPPPPWLDDLRWPWESEEELGRVEALLNQGMESFDNMGEFLDRMWN